MYNFNFSSAMSTSMVGIDLGANTPRTPEILNSLIAMTNPFEYMPPSNHLSSLHDSNDLRPSDRDENKFQSFQFDNSSQSNASSSSSSSSSEGEATTSGSNLTFQMAASISSTPSLQQTRSQLIKAGVKLLIQNKRKNSGSSCDAEQQPEKVRVLSPKFTASRNSRNSTTNNNNENRSIKKKRMISTVKTNSSCDESSSERTFSTNKLELTIEDEDRRRRRRERNKIAATKCRLKKRECINNLMRESESLETQNVELKNQLKDLREQQRYLDEMWQAHQLECSLRKHDLVSTSTLNPLVTNGNQHGSRQAKSKDNNNNKQNLNVTNQLPSFSPLINCNLSFDYY